MAFGGLLLGPNRFRRNNLLLGQRLQQNVTLNQGLNKPPGSGNTILSQGVSNSGLVFLPNGTLARTVNNGGTSPRQPGQSSKPQQGPSRTRSVLLCLIVVVITLILLGAILGVTLWLVLGTRGPNPRTTQPPVITPVVPFVIPPNAPIPPITSPPDANIAEGDLFLTGICGTQPVINPNTRILGGSDAMPGEWPWMGSLRDSLGNHKCGAVLIGERYALTAAHCIDNFGNTENKPVIAVFGDISVTVQDPVYHQESVFQYQWHESWIPEQSSLEFDIAVLYLNRRIRFTDYVLPICLATLQPESDIYRLCYVTGWGARFEPLAGQATTFPYPQWLQERQLPILTTEQCTSAATEFASNKILCDAGIPNTGTCSGDSGGPLVCESRLDNRWHLTGIISSGVGCGSGVPAFYTRISYFKDWIKVIAGAP